MEPEGSLPQSQVPAGEPDLSSSRLHIQLPEDPNGYYLIYTWAFQVVFPRFPTKILYIPLLYPIRATCLVHFIILDLIIRTELGEYRSLSLTLFSALHSPVTSSLLGLNILLSIYSQRPLAYVPPSL